MDNTPIAGCEGCKTTGGRMSCYSHGNRFNQISKSEEYGYGSKIRCPKHNELVACPECCEEEADEMSRVINRSF
jgi:hypothetical protein